MESSQRFMCENKLCYGNQNQLCTISVIDFDKESIGKKYDWVVPLQCFIYNCIYNLCAKCNADRKCTSLFIKSRLARHNSQHTVCHKVTATNEEDKCEHEDNSDVNIEINKYPIDKISSDRHVFFSISIWRQ